MKPKLIANALLRLADLSRLQSDFAPAGRSAHAERFLARARLRTLACWLLLLAGAIPAPAQWLTQSLALKPGWSAVYLHVDASHDSLSNLVAADLSNPITEIWMWSPPSSTVQFVNSPQTPSSSGGQWISWDRQDISASSLQNLVGNAACLVHIPTNAAAYTWKVKGKPVPPAYQWSTTGLNFLGFPTVTSAPPMFEAFLSKAPELQQNKEIYYYPGGELGVANPARLVALRTSPVTRGQAYWIRAGEGYNHYFAPFEVTLSGSSGLSYADTLNTRGFRLRNLTDAPLTLTQRLVASETAPAQQTNVTGLPPLLLRGTLNTTNLAYAYSKLLPAGSNTWRLAAKGQPGSEVEVVLGLDRPAMTGSVGDLKAAVVRLTDSLGYAQVDLPVSATVASSAGLWVGSVAITQVGQYLKTYARDSANNPVVSSNGQYVALSTNTSLGSVPNPVSLRLIVHNPEAGGQAVLLQRVYVGVDAATNAIVARQESALNSAFRSAARRISATHLPWTSQNTPWPFNSTLEGAASLTATVTLDYADQASNPFLHTYHPDHDNLDATFANQLPQGAESFSVRRDITLTPTAPAGDASDFKAGERTISGDYAETITVLGLARAGGTHDARTYQVRGVFSLTRLCGVPVLTTP